MSIYGPLHSALVRPLPRSFLSALKKHKPETPIDWDLAHAQHEAYTKAVQAHVANVTVVPVDENHPDCCFIEDTAIVSGRDIVISRIGAESRRDESGAVANVFESLRSSDFALTIHRLFAPATLDGGDVLQMGEHIFVGLSERSNKAAVDQLKDLLPTRKITAVPVADGLHLKSVLSALSDSVLLAADLPPVYAMASQILETLGSSARCVYVPDAIAANVLRLDRVLVIQAGYPKSESILRKEAEREGLDVIALNMSELTKADGALTCCSLLVPQI